MEDLKQSLENVLNLSKTRKLKLEKEVAAWRDYLNVLQRVQQIISQAEQDTNEQVPDHLSIALLKEQKQKLERLKVDVQVLKRCFLSVLIMTAGASCCEECTNFCSIGKIQMIFLVSNDFPKTIFEILNFILFVKSN